MTDEQEQQAQEEAQQCREFISVDCSRAIISVGSSTAKIGEVAGVVRWLKKNVLDNKPKKNKMRHYAG